ncbi:MAG: LysM peptidoglycan-binding domain-containing protein [Chloroflexota bacterium]
MVPPESSNRSQIWVAIIIFINVIVALVLAIGLSSADNLSLFSDGGVTFEDEERGGIAVLPDDVGDPSVSITNPTATFTPTPLTQPTEMELAVDGAMPTETATPLPTSTRPTPQSFSPESVATYIAPNCVVTQPNGWNPYMVQAGDTLFRLSILGNTSMERIREVNCLPSLSLRSGATIFLPVESSAIPEASCNIRSDWDQYTVQPGDTLFRLGRTVGLTTSEIIYSNCLVTTSIRAGDVLRLPLSPLPVVTVSLTPFATSTPVPTVDGSGGGDDDDETSTPTSTPTSTATDTHTPTPTLTSSPSSTPTPLVMPTNTETPIPPTAVPSETFTPTPSPTTPVSGTAAVIDPQRGSVNGTFSLLSIGLIFGILIMQKKRLPEDVE